MKKYQRFLPLLLLSLFFSSGRAFAQSPGKWTDWSTASCHQGISVSVVNMGHSKSAGGYLWGIRLRNDYSLPITFRYRLSIGEKNTTQEGGDAVWKLKPGEIWTDGNDKFTAKLFQSSSIEYYYFIWNVCFDGAKCGGASNCYASCDAIKGKENQPCGKEPVPVAKTKPLGPAPDPAPAPTNNKPTTTEAGKTKTATTKTNPSVFNKAEVERESRKATDLYCKLAEMESKLIALEEAEKPDEKLYNKLNKEFEKLCKECWDFINLLNDKYSEDKNKQAHKLWNKIWGEGYDKCPYHYDGGCSQFQ